MTALPAQQAPVAAGDPCIEACRRLYAHPNWASKAERIDPWREFLEGVDLVEGPVCLIVRHLLKKRDAIFDKLDADGWLWCPVLSRELDGLDLALEKLGVHPGGGRQ